MKDTFEGTDHGKDIINLNHLKPPVQEFRPTEVHLKADGDIDGQPSICIVMEAHNGTVIGQLSVKMWNKGLADIGYKMVKI